MSAPTKPFPLHLTEEQLARYKSAAHARQMSLSALIRQLLDGASGVQVVPGVIMPPPPPGAAPVKKSMFGAPPPLPEHHEEIMTILQGVPLANYCRQYRLENPRPWVPPMVEGGPRLPLPDCWLQPAAPEPEKPVNISPAPEVTKDNPVAFTWSGDSEETKADAREREWAERREQQGE